MNIPIAETRPTYYLLGKNRPSFGKAVLNSLSALNFHALAVIPNITATMIAVFAFQLLGWEYQPPAGDQTCLGYLPGEKVSDILFGRILKVEISSKNLRNFVAPAALEIGQHSFCGIRQ